MIHALLLFVMLLYLHASNPMTFQQERNTKTLAVWWNIITCTNITTKQKKTAKIIWKNSSEVTMRLRTEKSYDFTWEHEISLPHNDKYDKLALKQSDLNWARPASQRVKTKGYEFNNQGYLATMHGVRSP